MGHGRRKEIIHALCLRPNRYWLCAATLHCIKVWNLKSKSIIQEMRPTTESSTSCKNLVIADNVGDNVGDIAGMGSDLFGSYAESSCAALVVASISSFGINHEFTAMVYPLLISSMCIIVCLITTLFATDFFEIKNVDKIEPGLKNQLIISTALMTVGIAVVSWIALHSLPSSFTILNFGVQKVVKTGNFSSVLLLVHGLVL